MEFWENLEEEKQAIENSIEKNFSLIKNKRLRESSAHLLKSGGKRIRPLLLTLAHKVAGESNTQAIATVATAIEYLHNWTLIHDDIIDKSDTRRNSLTVHKKWDTDTAILAGDALANLVFLLVAKSNIEKKEKVMEILSDTALTILDGEMMDVDFEKSAEITSEKSLEMVEKKTSTLITSSIKLGAILATNEESIINSLSDYGYSIGIAFQIQDDLLDLLGEQTKVGKNLGRDIAEGKKTLIVIHSLNNSPETKNRLLEILQKKENTEDEIKEAINILKESGSIDYARQELKKYLGQAREKLKEIPDSIYKEKLIELTDFFETRTY
ncbi:hypothetical protein CO155_04240 [Candidatus Pacearchaeota archaeon CG_4_9_14_3_um_filter_35_19]|nr:polyprenyl synthetase family protein [Candidatus Pacearchaeota archaeon]OIO43153.1 MAG: hypothetical protein AUJ63_01015 [Candidatus Pacearchaeota archaeon CG1_02_35_32]PIY81596.1 MAG: hypothetical protein COY79_02575 [Candidatus Pacearchaeota archaeon CG_4_10_14_0_8_um_filter_35_169]PJA69768.1 MAG: hypothetical protein CO155_04240 [Candidatus Pacearchaeota archaeon CG_4_9_14_3_um_filter_35_19]